MTNNGEKPKMYILAGPNGSGKTSVLLKTIPEDVTILNADEIAREIAKGMGIPDDEIQAAVNKNEVLKLAGMRELTARMRECIERKESFAPETTLDAKSYEKYIKNAKSNGFEVELLYVGTKHHQINIDRVTYRATQGGHNIESTTVKKRYYGSLERLPLYIELVDRAKIHDNTEEPRRVISIDHGKIIEKNEPIPDWINKYVIEKLVTPTIIFHRRR
ncbi:MAG: zeta toxin family protein [Synergistaceae bacterium]|nr:zeta toxin family protein [Synergistaceae bacterium]